VKVHLYIRVRLSNGTRQYLDPVYAANGKLRPLYALVAGNPEHHPEGVYPLLTPHLETSLRPHRSSGRTGHHD